MNLNQKIRDTLFYKFLLFGIVGAIGFIVDVTVLYSFIYIFGLNYLLSRVFSYLFAATTTWYLNRNITFIESNSSNPFKEWIHFLIANSIGGVINFTVYTVTILYIPKTIFSPFIGVALGAISGMVFNFFISKNFIFKKD